MGNHGRRGMAAMLIACLSLSALTACGKKDGTETLDKTAALVTLEDGGTINAGLANLILRYGQADFESGFGSFIKSYYGDIWSTDLTGSGTSYGETFKQQMVTEMEHMLLDESHMEELGVEITADEEKAIASAARQFLSDNADYGAALEKMSADQETVEQMLRYYTIKAKVEKVMTQDVDTEVSDEEAAQRTVSYLAYTASTEAETESISEDATEDSSETVTETSASEQIGETAGEVAKASMDAETEVKTSSVQSETETLSEGTESVAEGIGNETETETETESESPEMIAARQKSREEAEAFLAKVQQVKDADEFESEASAAAEGQSNANASSFTFGEGDSYPDEAIIEATRDLEDNTLVDQVIQAGTSYYVLYVKDALDEEATADKKDQIVEQRRSDAIDQQYEDWMNEASFTVDEDLLATFLFDFSLTEETESATEEVSEALGEGQSEGMSEGLSEGVAESVE